MVSVIQPFNIFGTSLGTFLLFLVFFFALYGILMGGGYFGDNKGILFIVAFVVALIFISSVNAISFLFGSLRSLVILFVIILIIFMAHGFLGIDMKTLMGNTPFGKAAPIILLVIVIFILLSNWRPVADDSGVSGPAVSGATSPWSGARAVQIVTSPSFLAVLGFLLIFGFLVKSATGVS